MPCDAESIFKLLYLFIYIYIYLNQRIRNNYDFFTITTRYDFFYIFSVRGI